MIKMLIVFYIMSGLQITVGHRTMTDQNLLNMSDEIQTVVGHNVWTIFFAFQRKCQRVLF